MLWNSKIMIVTNLACLTLLCLNFFHFYNDQNCGESFLKVILMRDGHTGKETLNKGLLHRFITIYIRFFLMHFTLQLKNLPAWRKYEWKNHTMQRNSFNKLRVYSSGFKQADALNIISQTKCPKSTDISVLVFWWPWSVMKLLHVS